MKAEVKLNATQILIKQLKEENQKLHSQIDHLGSGSDEAAAAAAWGPKRLRKARTEGNPNWPREPFVNQLVLINGPDGG